MANTQKLSITKKMALLCPICLGPVFVQFLRYSICYWCGKTQSNNQVLNTDFIVKNTNRQFIQVYRFKSKPLNCIMQFDQIFEEFKKFNVIRVCELVLPD